MIRGFALFGLIMCASGCGYHVSGHGDAMPASLQTIAIAPFGNTTTRYHLSEELPAAIGRELISRTRYRVVPDLDKADAVLRGRVLNVYSYATTFDPISNRASAVQIGVVLQLSLVDRVSGKVLYNRPTMEYKQRYEVSTLQPNPTDQALNRNVYFDESDAALDRVSREVAHAVVSGILETF